MATLALIPIAAAITSGASATTVAVVGAVATVAGAVIDSQLLFPAIFGKDSKDLQGPRIDDFQITTASPGSPVNYCLGRENRVPGALIWTSAIREIPHETGEGGKGGGSVTTFTNKIDIAIAVCEGPIESIDVIWADGKRIYEEVIEDRSRFDGITFYLGDLAQGPDATIEAAEGAGNVPGFRGIAYVVFKGLSLSDFGGRIPSFSFLVRQSSQKLLSDAFTDILGRAGRDIADFDAEWLQGVELRGYNVSGPQPPAKILEPLIAAYDVMAQEKDGVVHFRRRSDIRPTDIDLANLAAHEEGQDTSRPYAVTRTLAPDLPGAVTVNYIDPDLFWQKNSQTYRPKSPDTPTTGTLEVPIVMSGDEGLSLSAKRFWSSQAEADEISLFLPPSRMDLLESDLLNVTQDGVPYTFRVTKLTRGANYLLEVSAVTEEVQTTDQTLTAQIPDVPSEAPPEGTLEGTLRMMDIPLLPREVEDKRLYYDGMCVDPGVNWRGGRIFRLEDVTTSEYLDVGVPNPYPTFLDLKTSPDWVETQTIRVEAPIGQVTAALPTTGPVGYWDMTSTMTVVMQEGTLASHTDDEVYAGANHAYVGSPADFTSGTNVISVWGNGRGELIAFANATLTAPRTYELSKFLRGRRDTVAAMAERSTNDAFVLLNYGVTDAKDMSLASGLKGIYADHYARSFQGKLKFYMGLPKGTMPGTTNGVVVPFIATGRPLKSFAPDHVTWVWDGTNNLILRWLRRAFDFFHELDVENGASFPESSERYEVDVYTADGVTFKRTLTSTTEGVVYSAANQATDGFTAGDSVMVKIYQINTALNASGRGNESVTVVDASNH